MVSASAPGRLDVMGGIGDYSGALVLQMPIEEQTHCTIERRSDGKLVVASENRPESVTIDMSRLVEGGDLHDLVAARAFFADEKNLHWASYVVGVVILFSREVTETNETHLADLSSGLKISVESEVPEGKGVSSSAALEVATMRALATLTEVDIAAERMAALCQEAENRVAGAPCGIMDQMTAACGERGRLMKLLCQPAQLEGFVDLPERVSVWGIDSGVRHAVTGSDYSTVRAAAFMGLRIIETIDPDLVAESHGYLVNIGSDWLYRNAAKLPIELDGASFLDTYGSISDEVVGIEPDRTYPILAATSYPILGRDRIRRFAVLLSNDPDTKRLAMAGEMMYLSHAGYSSCGLGSAGTDKIVDMVRSIGYKGGLFGARITGGGSGGTVAVLGRTDAFARVEEIADAYQSETGRETQIF